MTDELDPSAGLDERRRADAHVLLNEGRAADLDVDVIELDEASGHHLVRVRRLRDDATITVTDGAGRWRLALLKGAGSGSPLLVATSHTRVAPSHTPFTLASALPKGDRLDWMVQKVTECGADRIVLMDCDRSVVRWKSDRAAKQLARLQRIADEAAQQSRRIHRAVVEGPLPAADVLPSAAVAEPGGVPIRSDHHVIGIGPEGGWSDAEWGMISQRVHLADTILRTETAAVVGTALCVARNH